MQNAAPRADDTPTGPTEGPRNLGDVATPALAALLSGVGERRDLASIQEALEGAGTGEPVRALRTAAERLGVALDSEPATRAALENRTPPFVIVDPAAGRVLCVEARLGTTLFVAGGDGPELSVRALARPGVAIVRPHPVADAEPIPQVGERIRARLRPVMWEIATASVVINLLALATPLFMMTVYNKVIGHGAMQTLDVLAVGMLTLFAFDGALRLLRGYVVSHAGARIDAAVGSDVIQHLLHLPLRDLQALTPGHVVEHLRQIDNLRLFFTGQVPLLWVDLGFVVLFLGVIAVLAPPLAVIVCAAIPLLVASSWWLSRRQRRIMAEGFRASAEKASAVGETVSNALTIKALGLESHVAKGFDDKLARNPASALRASVAS
ncbi:MAG: ABC transporter transmembrane domain-containing protein, partial [Pseudomonadota bacterium]